MDSIDALAAPQGAKDSPVNKKAKLGSRSVCASPLDRPTPSPDWWEWCWDEHPSLAAATQSARLEVALVNGTSSATHVYGTYPMRLFVPSKTAAPGTNAIWAYSSSHGGGIVSGDKTGMRVVIASGCACVVATQGSTKVYKQRLQHALPDAGGGRALQVLVGTVQANSLLAVLPDPIICFENADFQQLQRINLLGGASLAMVDWMVPGRVGYGAGERWAFQAYESVLQVAIDGRQVIHDPVRLEAGAGLSVAQQMGAVHAMGVMVLVGPRLAETCERAKSIVAENARTHVRGGAGWVRQPPEPMPVGARVIASSSPVQGGILIRFASESTPAAYSFLQHVLSPLAQQLGAAPYNERGHS
mmetsp:Transcript_24372/g.63294  ORF Transcript_24372/g.63294 Transcript_24372/m.63294 type:complete len:359 (-) Transcript_24372:3143-4219(-)|eukprot:jgi/Tetstr1/445608/TSEL_003414.t2